MDIRQLFKPAKTEKSVNLTIEVTFKPLTQGDGTDDGQEQIREKLSVSVPAAPVPRPNPALLNYKGQRVRVVLRDGITLVGNPQRTEWDYLRLTDVQETGEAYELTADWITIKSDTIARIYPANAKIQKTDAE